METKVILPSKRPPAVSVALTVDSNPESPLEFLELLEGGRQDNRRTLEDIARAPRDVRSGIYAFEPVGVGLSYAKALAHDTCRAVVRLVTDDGLVSACVSTAPTSRQNATILRLNNSSELS